MYRMAARVMRSRPEYRDNYVFIEYLIHLMIQEESDDKMILSIVIQVTLCSTARLVHPCRNMAGRIKAIAKNLHQRKLVMHYQMPSPGLKMPLTT